jgi:SAM-dependent methyltransferase
VAHDAGHWDARYAAADTHQRSDGHQLSEPDPAVVEAALEAEAEAEVEAVGPFPPGRALDLAAGRGRHALWLAGQGWAVTAVDFSAVGIELGRTLEEQATRAPARNEATARHIRRTVASLGAQQQGAEVRVEPITWVVADLRTWAPPPVPDSMPSEATGYDLVLCAFVHLDPPDFARVRTWLTPSGHLVVVSHGPGSPDGPGNPAYRYDEQQLRAAAEGLTIELLDQRDDRLVLIARRP